MLLYVIVVASGLHLRGGGEGHSPPLDMLLPPLNYHAMCLHTQTYIILPPLSHFLGEGLNMGASSLPHQGLF